MPILQMNVYRFLRYKNFGNSCWRYLKKPQKNRVDKKHLLELANYKMPFGKYEGWYLQDIPEYYFVWFKQKGFPPGKLGRLMEEMLELKMNGIEGILRPLKSVK